MNIFPALRRLNAWLAVFAGVIFALISIMVVVEVAARIAGAGIGGIREASENLLVLAVALAFADTQRHEGNIAVELFTALMSARIRKAADIIGKIVCLALVALIAYGLVRAAGKSLSIGEYQFSTLGNIPIWPTKMALSGGFLLLAVEFLIATVQAARSADSHVGDAGDGATINV